MKKIINFFKSLSKRITEFFSVDAFGIRGGGYTPVGSKDFDPNKVQFPLGGGTVTGRSKCCKNRGWPNFPTGELIVVENNYSNVRLTPPPDDEYKCQCGRK